MNRALATLEHLATLCITVPAHLYARVVRARDEHRARRARRRYDRAFASWTARDRFAEGGWVESGRTGAGGAWWTR